MARTHGAKSTGKDITLLIGHISVSAITAVGIRMVQLGQDLCGWLIQHKEKMIVFLDR